MSNEYIINQSRLFRQSNKRKPAELLNVSKKEMLPVLVSPKYKLWNTKPKYPSTALELRHKSRNIQKPTRLLRKIQDRLAELLVRIETPEYLFSAKKGRSYVSNASSHTGSGQAIRIDIKVFFKTPAIDLSVAFFWMIYSAAQTLPMF